MEAPIFGAPALLRVVLPATPGLRHCFKVGIPLINSAALIRPRDCPESISYALDNDLISLSPYAFVACLRQQDAVLHLPGGYLPLPRIPGTALLFGKRLQSGKMARRCCMKQGPSDVGSLLDPHSVLNRHDIE